MSQKTRRHHQSYVGCQLAVTCVVCQVSDSDTRYSVELHLIELAPPSENAKPAVLAAEYITSALLSSTKAYLSFIASRYDHC